MFFIFNVCLFIFLFWRISLLSKGWDALLYEQQRIVDLWDRLDEKHQEYLRKESGSDI